MSAILRIFIGSLWLVFSLSGCNQSQSGWLGTGTTKEKIYLTPLSQAAVSVPTGENRTVTFSATIVLGASNEDVVFSASGLPDSTTAVFSPSFCKANLSGCPVFMTVSAGATALGGATPFTIIGTGDSSGKTATLAATLIVLPTLTILKPINGTITEGKKINCGTSGSDCLGNYAGGTNVTLTATPDADFRFVDWGGNCSGSEMTCPLTMNAAKMVTATFTLKTFSLSVATVGSGNVSSNISGINCGADCTEDYTIGTMVALTATPVTGGAFTKWSGGCSGTGGCKVTMDAPKSVTAEFTPVFKAATNYPVLVSTSKPYSIAMGDLDGDKKLDLVVGYFNTNIPISILKGNGDGSFATSTATSTPVDMGPNTVVIGDFNADGKGDIATANEGGDTLSVLLGDGAGMFSTSTPPLSVGDGPRSIAAGDLNGDEKLDIVTANLNSHNVSVLLGDGTGSFGPLNNYPVGTHPDSVAISDIDGDHKNDIVVANFSDNTVSILIGNGDGTFVNASNSPLLAVEPTGTSALNAVAVADLNHDGKMDIVTANRDTNKVSILLGIGGGQFSAPKDFTVGASPRFVTMGDINGDGNIDIVTANFNSNDVSVLLGDGAGGIQSSMSFSVGTGPRSVAIKDLNGDGKPDLVTANSTSHDISVLLNQ